MFKLYDLASSFYFFSVFSLNKFDGFAYKLLGGETIIVVAEKEIAFKDSSEELFDFDYAQILDYTKFEPPAELSLPAYVFGLDKN